MAGNRDVDQTQAHLPEEPNRFIGRERELAELRRMVRQARALTLCGPGGIGKTRLALRILSGAAASFPTEPAWSSWPTCAQPDLVTSRVRRRRRQRGARAPAARHAGRRAAAPPAVLALDNCEHLIDACAQLSQRLLAGSPGLRLLNTSREPLGVAGETVWRVPPLSVPRPRRSRQ